MEMREIDPIKAKDLRSKLKRIMAGKGAMGWGVEGFG